VQKAGTISQLHARTPACLLALFLSNPEKQRAHAGRFQLDVVSLLVYAHLTTAIHEAFTGAVRLDHEFNPENRRRVCRDDRAADDFPFGASGVIKSTAEPACAS
jgi:hypothetical protein